MWFAGLTATFQTITKQKRKKLQIQWKGDIFNSSLSTNIEWFMPDPAWHGEN